MLMKNVYVSVSVCTREKKSGVLRLEYRVHVEENRQHKKSVAVADKLFPRRGIFRIGLQGRCLFPPPPSFSRISFLFKWRTTSKVIRLNCMSPWTAAEDCKICVREFVVNLCVRCQNGQQLLCTVHTVTHWHTRMYWGRGEQIKNRGDVCVTVTIKDRHWHSDCQQTE